MHDFQLGAGIFQVEGAGMSRDLLFCLTEVVVFGLFAFLPAFLLEQLVFAIDLGEGGNTVDEPHQSGVLPLEFLQLTMTQNIILLLLTERVLTIKVLIPQHRTLPHMFLINLNQSLIMQLILFKHKHRLIRT